MTSHAGSGPRARNERSVGSDPVRLVAQPLPGQRPPRTPGDAAHTRGRTAPHTGGVRNSGAGERRAAVPSVPMSVVAGTPSERRHPFRPSLASARCRVTFTILQRLPYLRQEHDALRHLPGLRRTDFVLRRTDFGVRRRYPLRHSPCILSSGSRRPRHKGA